MSNGTRQETSSKTKGRRVQCAVLELLFARAADLRAGMPQTVITEIGSRSRIVGAEALRAIARIVAAGRRGNRHRPATDIRVVEMGGPPAVAAITIRVLRSDCAADHG